MSAREIDLGEYIELPAGDRNAPLSISSGQADELDAAVVLPELRTFAPDDFFTSCDADELQELASLDLQCAFMARLELDGRAS
jgi:hypothetical protein